MRDFFNPRVRTGMRLHDYAHAAVTLVAIIALVAIGFGAGYRTAAHRYTASYWRQHYPAVRNFTAPGVKALPLLAQAPSATAGSINLAYWRVKTNNQGTVGSCQSWANAKLLSFEYNAATHHAAFFSPRAYYDAATGGQDVGSNIVQYPPLVAQLGGIRWTTFPYAANKYGLPVFGDEATLPAGVTTGAVHLTETLHPLFTDSGSGIGGEQLIEQAILSGHPVNIAFPVYPEYDNANASNPYIGLPLPGEQSRGGHANVLIAFRTDANGQVWFLTSNQWGKTYWGGLDDRGVRSTTNGGYAWMSGAFVAAYGWDAMTVSVS